jgi:hypothetical protein
MNDKKPYFNLDGFTLTGKKAVDSAWRNPSFGFGYYNYRPRITFMRNKVEPIGSTGWRDNIVNYELDTNGMGIFIEGVEQIIASKEDGEISVEVHETKFENGRYVRGETMVVGTVKFAVKEGVALMQLTTTVDDVVFIFGNTFRTLFYGKDGVKMSIEQKSKLDALAKFKGFKASIPLVQMEYTMSKQK